MVRPRRKRAEELSEYQPAERKHTSHERPRPAPPQISELRNRLGEQNLQHVPLEVAQDRRPKDCRNDDDPKKAGTNIIQNVCIRPIQQHLAVGRPNRPKALTRNTEEAEGAP